MKHVFAVAFLTCLLAGQAYAHSKLSSSVPMDGQAMQASPSNVVLEFSQKMRLATVTLQQDPDPEFRLDVPRGNAATAFEIPIDRELTPGTVSVNWRGVGPDGHIQTGLFTFIIAPE